MKTQKNFLEEFSNRIFQNAKKFSKGIFQQNFLEPYAVNVYKNLKAGVSSIAQATQEDERFWEEGGIRIQENRPKNGGREEA